MITFDIEQNQYRPLFYKIGYTVHFSPVVQYVDDPRPLEEFVSRWWYLNDLDIQTLVLTPEQQTRLNAINSAPLADTKPWLEELKLYVEHDLIFENTASPFLSVRYDPVKTNDALYAIAKSKTFVDLAKHRFEKETEGLLINGITVRTDRQSQGLITAAFSSLNNGFINSIDWKGANGWITLSLNEVTMIAQEVGKHVQRSFSAERFVQEQINAMTTPGEVSDYDWELSFESHYTELKNTA